MAKGADIFQKTRIVPRGPSVRSQRKDLESRLFSEDHPKESFWPKESRLASDHTSMSTLHKTMRFADGVKMFQRCSLGPGRGENKETKGLQELEPNHGMTEAELRCKQRHHHFARERLEGISGSRSPQPTTPTRGAPFKPGKVLLSFL